MKIRIPKLSKSTRGKIGQGHQESVYNEANFVVVVVWHFPSLGRIFQKQGRVGEPGQGISLSSFEVFLLVLR